MKSYTYRKIPKLHIQSCCQTAPQAHMAPRERELRFPGDTGPTTKVVITTCNCYGVVSVPERN